MSSSSLLSHALPYALFVALGAAASSLPTGWGPWADPARVLLAGLALVWFWRRGAYPELGERGTPAPGATLLAVGAGVAVGLLWIPLTPAWLPTLGSRDGFDPAAAGQAAVWALWAARVAGLVLVVPFAEELLVRSLLPRFVDAGEPGQDWRDLPVGVFTVASFAVSVAFFTVTHPEWLAALVTGVLWTALLMRTRRLRDAVLAHAVANGVLGAWVVLSGDLTWI